MFSVLFWQDSWFFICVSKLSSSGRMFQNIINNWENLDQDKNSLMFVLIAPILFLQLSLGHFNTAWSLRSGQNSTQDFQMTRRSTTTKQLSLMRPGEDLHKKLYCLIDMDLLDLDLLLILNSARTMYCASVCAHKI